MRLKHLFLLPTIIAGITAVSVSCYGGSANDSTTTNPNNMTNGTTNGTTNGSANINKSAPTNTYGKPTLPTTSSTYSSTTTVTKTNPNTPGKTPTTSFGNQGNSCSTTDISVFEEADEEGIYGDYGFTRGDIKNLFIAKYDPKSEQTINGNVMRILRVQFTDGNCYLIGVVHIDSGVILVNLGPVWFADEHNMVINEGDAVQITGSLIRTNGRYILVGSQLKKDGQTLQLRNQSGNPQWGAPRSQKGTNAY